MKMFTLMLLALIALCKGAEWDTIQVRYAYPNISEGYYEMPWTVQEAIKERWVKATEDTELNVDVYSLPNVPKLMLLFDKQGTIAGIRMGFLTDEVTAKAIQGGYEFLFHYDNNPKYEPATIFGKDLWQTTAIFVAPDKLATGGRKCPNKDTDDVAEGLYWKVGGEYMEIDKDECVPLGDFVEAPCVHGMGHHYYYKLKGEDCTRLQAFFKLYDQGRLMGFGFIGIGGFTLDPDTTNYYEAFPVQVIDKFIKKRPKCFDEFVEKFGVTQMHVFLSKKAKTLKCPEITWPEEHCQEQ